MHSPCTAVLMIRCGGIKPIFKPPATVAQMWLSGNCVDLLDKAAFIHAL